MKLKLNKHWTTGKTALKRFKTAFQRDINKLNKFKIALNKRFKALLDLLEEDENTMDANWKEIKEALTSTCQEMLGRNEHHHVELVSIETLDKIQERKDKKIAINNKGTRAKNVKTQAEYTEVNEQVDRSIRVDKQKYVEDLW
ncbi:unnamed protein product, partial [Schistosoma curassoni]|uniref:Gag-pol polyprotein n=1 Tax=Schistosoma curassoni TaxID=6186 RepID=A0A183JNK4_9TREM